MQSIEKPKEQKQTEDIISKQNTVIPGISKFRQAISVKYFTIT